MLQRTGLARERCYKGFKCRGRVGGLLREQKENEKMSAILWTLSLILNALHPAYAEAVREVASDLRREGHAIPSVNHRVVVIPHHAPTCEADGLVSVLVERAFIRASLLRHRAIEHAEGLRHLCDCGAYFPKNSRRCRICYRSVQWLSERVLRNGECTTYEPRVEMLGIRLIEKVRGLRSAWDARYCILKPTLRKGMLRNGNNAAVWMVSLGRSAHKVAAALDDLGLTAEAAVYWAMSPRAQVWRRVVFFDYLHEWDNETVREGCVDVALAETLTATGYKVRDGPRTSVRTDSGC